MDDAQLINNLNKLKQGPDPEWRERARARLEVLSSDNAAESLTAMDDQLSSNNVVTGFTHTRNPLQTLLFNFQLMHRKTLLVGGTLTVIALLGGGFLLANIIGRNMRTEQTATLTAAQQQQILAQVLRNNSQISQASRNQTNTNDAADSDANTLLGERLTAEYSPLPVDPGIGGGIWQPDYKFRETTSIMTLGPAQARCAGYGTYNVAGTTHSVDYYADDGYVYSKYSQKDADGNLLYYYLSKPENDRNATYDYRGGSYAVRNLYAASPTFYSARTDTPTSEGAVVDLDTTATVAAEPTATDIGNYFGPDAKITKEITEGGRKYYEIEYSWDINCDDDGGVKLLYISAVGSVGETTNKIVNVQVVDADTFEITEYRVYLDSVDANNLLSATDSQVTVNNNELSTVAGKFDFEYSVTVRDLDWETLSAQQQAEQQTKANDYISSNSIYLPMNTAEGYTNSISVNLEYTPIAGSDYAQDRNFYPSGAVGDRLFAEMNPVIDAGQPYPNPIIYTSYSDSTYSNSFSASIYEASDYSLADIGATYAQGEHVSVVEAPATINIAGQQIIGTKYTITDNSSVAYAELYPAPDYQPTPYIYEQVLFTLGSYHYQLSQYSFDEATNVSSQGFSAGEITVPSLFTGNASELAQILSLIEQGYRGIAVDAVPATEPALY
jgi:hypothetical protein